MDRKICRNARRRRTLAAFAGLAVFATIVLAGLVYAAGPPPQIALSRRQEVPHRHARLEVWQQQQEARQQQQEPRQAVRKVLLIGIDGVRPDILAEVSTPHLDSLISEGAFSDSAYTTRPTLSGPGWSSMLTGVWPAKHGVVTNVFRGNRYEQYPDFLTRIERSRPELRTFVVADWLPLVAKESGGPLFGDAPDLKLVLNGYDLGWAEADERAVDAAVEHLRTADPDALFVYLGNPDETSHDTRAIGEEYRAAIEQADRQVGRLVSAVRARPTHADENWLVLVSTDHGRRSDGGHGGDSPEEKTIFLLLSGPSAARGRIPGTPAVVDVAVTALVHLGISLDPTWDLDGTAVGLADRARAR